ncbi:hypothetical protein MN0502_27240 [Arthrobacter sp. MN05-02]|nr:hypothetical protein MN0502_27240 [Arthrobacter sp. MN05-02]
MVPNASEDFPEPETPVKATTASRGQSTSIPRRLFSPAPRTRTKPFRVLVVPAGAASIGSITNPTLRPSGDATRRETHRRRADHRSVVARAEGTRPGHHGIDPAVMRS